MSEEQFVRLLDKTAFAQKLWHESSSLLNEARVSVGARISGDVQVSCLYILSCACQENRGEPFLWRWPSSGTTHWLRSMAVARWQTSRLNSD